MYPLAALKLSLYRLADEVRSLLAFVQNSVNPVKSSGWESGRRLLFVYALASHTRNIVDIIYLDKRRDM